MTAAEFIPAWAGVTSMSQELSTAYFYLADIDDSGQITSSDLNLVYQRFDINGEMKSAESTEGGTKVMEDVGVGSTGGDAQDSKLRENRIYA